MSTVSDMSVANHVDAFMSRSRRNMAIATVAGGVLTGLLVASNSEVTGNRGLAALASVATGAGLGLAIDQGILGDYVGTGSLVECGACLLVSATVSSMVGGVVCNLTTKVIDESEL